MQMTDIPFGTTDWSLVQLTEHKGETGMAIWRTCQFGTIRVRMVEYTPGYLADHWCVKGHILLCLEGELHTELEDGRTFVLASKPQFELLTTNDLKDGSIFDATPALADNWLLVRSDHFRSCIGQK